MCTILHISVYIQTVIQCEDFAKLTFFGFWNSGCDRFNPFQPVSTRFNAFQPPSGTTRRRARSSAADAPTSPLSSSSAASPSRNRYVYIGKTDGKTDGRENGGRERRERTGRENGEREWGMGERTMVEDDGGRRGAGRGRVESRDRRKTETY